MGQCIFNILFACLPPIVSSDPSPPVVVDIIRAMLALTLNFQFSKWTERKKNQRQNPRWEYLSIYRYLKCLLSLQFIDHKTCIFGHGFFSHWLQRQKYQYVNKALAKSENPLRVTYKHCQIIWKNYSISGVLRIFNLYLCVYFLT